MIYIKILYSFFNYSILHYFCSYIKVGPFLLFLNIFSDKKLNKYTYKDNLMI